MKQGIFQSEQSSEAQGFSASHCRGRKLIIPSFKNTNMLAGAVAAVEVLHLALPLRECAVGNRADCQPPDPLGVRGGHVLQSCSQPVSEHGRHT